MQTTGYTTLTRQSGLMREMQSIANNIANSSTIGYRREGLIFSEYIVDVDGPGGSLSMAEANVRNTDFGQAPLTQTKGAFDFAIEGEGFFLLDTPQGQRLTRAGSFTPDAAGNLVSPDGYPLLDAGGAPVFAPPDAASVAVAADGTISADGRPLTQIGVYLPADPNAMTHVAGTLFDPGGATEPVLESSILQGFVEQSNVDPMTEISRMIEVQHAYELGQKFLEREDERVRDVIRTLGSSS
ncbi:flagellar basal-body rod protein FlgF [Rhodovulum sulfidophilum]|uniref:flagellar hook-basal body complex protein n=1 Tax=Rhodovulum sulfidophilum TaxID=35806 RepID=UPI001389EABA|nr:flagellar hook-basal body complex protein [Rhodovulum sulfidophilum]MBK5925013.1 flagellar basal-body rod protein FlgF [Rhodovulum sulfidophilum]NDK36325.1 flagellar hook-basal body complex protein [Rhodovulum sulfidophilum]